MEFVKNLENYIPVEFQIRTWMRIFYFHISKPSISNWIFRLIVKILAPFRIIQDFVEGTRFYFRKTKTVFFSHMIFEWPLIIQQKLIQQLNEKLWIKLLNYVKAKIIKQVSNFNDFLEMNWNFYSKPFHLKIFLIFNFIFNPK